MKSKKFRPNVVAVIIHPTENKVLMFRRLTKRNEKVEFLSDGIQQLRWDLQKQIGFLEVDSARSHTVGVTESYLRAEESIRNRNNHEKHLSTR